MKHLFWLCALLLLCGCTDNIVENIPTSSNYEFYATFEDSQSRTYLDDRRMRWHEKDCVTLFEKTTYNRTYMFTGKTGANAGGFTQVSTDDKFWYGEPLEYNYAVYPSSSDIFFDETDCAFTVMMPEEQSFLEKSFGKGANTMVSISESNQLIFKNVCSYICLRLYGKDISVSSIILTSKNDQALSGKAKITPILDGAPTCEMLDSGKSICLNCPVPVAISENAEAPTEFWIVVPPVTLSDGFSVIVTNSNEKTQIYEVENSLTFERNKYYSLTREVNVTSDDQDDTDDGNDDDEIIIPSSGTPYLAFTSDAHQSLTMSRVVSGIQYSLNDGEWMELGNKTIAFGAEKGTLRLRGKNPYGTALDLSNFSTIKFENTTPVTCTGDIRALLDYDNHLSVNTESAKFIYLFKDCSNLISAPLLPATQLSAACYYGMFDGCSNLVEAPLLPSTSLAVNCYSYMFNNCVSLTQVQSALPATMLAKECYQSMFNNCKSLKSAPELPATALAESCYSSMFANCQNLTKAPQLPATTLAKRCYTSMFSYCSNLTTAPSVLPAMTLSPDCYQNMFNSCLKLLVAPQLPATTLAENCYKTMFIGCESLNVVPELPAMTLAKSCYAEMFENCKKINVTPQLPATVLSDNCYERMFYNCIGLTTTTQLPAVTLANNCYKRMFYNCINIVNPPALPATTLTVGCYYEMFMKCNQLAAAPILPAQKLQTNCYYQMFNFCSNLKSITMLATNVSASNCLVKWVNGVYSSGIFTKAKSMESLTEGANGIPEGWDVVNIIE